MTTEKRQLQVLIASIWTGIFFLSLVGSLLTAILTGNIWIWGLSCLMLVIDCASGLIWYKQNQQFNALAAAAKVEANLSSWQQIFTRLIELVLAIVQQRLQVTADKNEEIDDDSD